MRVKLDILGIYPCYGTQTRDRTLSYSMLLSSPAVISMKEQLAVRFIRGTSTRGGTSFDLCNNTLPAGYY